MAHKAPKGLTLLIALLLLALSGCGGIVLVVGGAVAGVVASQEDSSHDDRAPPACAAELNAVYDGLGPDGASVLSIEIQIDSTNPDSARVWIGTADSGVFHTLIDIQSPTDPITWVESGPEMSGLSVRSLSASPLDNDILLAGTDQGLYRSLDGGTAWTRIFLPGPDQEVGHVVYAPWDPQGNAFAATPAAIYRSTDNGASWAKELSGPEGAVTGFASLHDGASALLFAGTNGSGVWQHGELGGWVPTPDRVPDPEVISIATSPINPPGGCGVVGGSLYAMTPTTVYISTDSGRSWTDWLPRIGVNQTVVALATTCNYHLAIFENDASGTRELVRSIDAGQNWSSAGAADKVLTLATHPDAPGAAFAGSEGESFLWNPAEGAPTAWFSLSEGLQGMKVLSLAVDPVDPLIVHAGTAGAGLYRTADGGTTWFPVALGGTGNSPYPIHVTAILMDPDFPDTLYVGTARGRIYEVVGGNSFSISRTPWESGHAVNAIEIDRRTQDLYVGFENGIYVRQGGQSLLIEWNQTLADRRVTALAVDASADPAQVYLGTRGGDVYLSTSRGITWDQMSINWPGAEVSDLVVTQGTVPPVLLAAIDGAGVYRFDGSAGQWERNSTCLASLDVQDLVTSIHFPGRVYAATLDGLFRLDSPGDRWEAIGGEQGENPTFTVAVPPWGAYSLYAGFSRGARRVSITE